MSETSISAQQLAGNFGLELFPIRSGTKQPAVNWSTTHSSDPEQITRWERQYPGCGWAWKIPDGCAVIDLDYRGGMLSRFVNWVREQDHVLDLVRAPSVKTRGGGRHLYFMVPAEAAPYLASVSPILRDVDGRGLADLKVGPTGYVLVPPSPGYSWVTPPDPDLSNLGDIPPWFVDAVRRQNNGRTPTKGRSMLDIGDLIEAQEKLAVIHPSERNDTLYARCCSLVGGHRQEPWMVLAFAQWFNSTLFDPPLPEDEVMRVVQSAERRREA